MSEIFTVWMGLMFGVPALILVIDFVTDAVRGLAASRKAPLAPTYEAGFNLRRPDSELRARHHYRVRPNGRTAETNKLVDDPYDL